MQDHYRRIRSTREDRNIGPGLMAIWINIESSIRELPNAYLGTASRQEVPACFSNLPAIPLYIMLRPLIPLIGILPFIPRKHPWFLGFSWATILSWMSRLQSDWHNSHTNQVLHQHPDLGRSKNWVFDFLNQKYGHYVQYGSTRRSSPRHSPALFRRINPISCPVSLRWILFPSRKIDSSKSVLSDALACVSLMYKSPSPSRYWRSSPKWDSR